MDELPVKTKARSFGQDLDRYRSLKALVEAPSAAEGERANAAAALERLKTRHPDLEEHIRGEDRKAEEAARRVRVREARRDAPPMRSPEPPFPTGPSHFGVSKLRSGNIDTQPGPGSIGAFGRWGRR